MADGRLFSPLTWADAKLELEQTLSCRPALHPQGSRWTIDLLRAACVHFIRAKGRGAFKRVMKSLKVSYQRARTYFHSPDADYELKLAYLRQIITSYKDGQTVILFEDELTYYNHASPAPDHCPQKHQPKAGLAIGGERSWRVIGALDIFNGKLIAQQRSAIQVPTFVSFLKQIALLYPQAKTIYLVLDNWPVHFHPDVLSALQKQTCPYPFLTPASWKNIKPKKYKGDKLPIQLVPLPTYASWLNPIEKIWRWLKQDLLHNHCFANNFKELKNKVEGFLNKLLTPSSETLAVVGLLKNDGIFAKELKSAGLLLLHLRC